MKFYGTFGQSHIDSAVGPLKEYYVEIFAPNIHRAYLMMADKYKSQWSCVYEYDEFNNGSTCRDPAKNYFPKGCIGQLGIKAPEDEADEIIRNIYEQRRNNRKAEELSNNNGECLPKE